MAQKLLAGKLNRDFSAERYLLVEDTSRSADRTRAKLRTELNAEHKGNKISTRDPSQRKCSR